MLTRLIRNLTAHYPHHAAREPRIWPMETFCFRPQQLTSMTRLKRVECFLPSSIRPIKTGGLLGTKCSEGPAVSRRR